MRIRWLAAGLHGRIVLNPARAGPWRASPASGPPCAGRAAFLARPVNPHAGHLDERHTAR
ncbi:hypothetical protein DF037_38475 [Burkholderia contaminans]|uniref:Uncharacterized protein n=1 Tax=Burkholderia contaminans TaxID=488447 RepID=A0A3N8R3S4_9BURK|nr:hypothetical protein DF037_38475 [Burkholderia contaminans]